MSRPGRGRKSRSFGVVVGVAALLAATLPLDSGAAQQAADEVPEGNWDGSLTFVASTPDGLAGAGSGSFTMTSAAGSLAGVASWVFDAGASADVTADVQGPSTAPEFQVTSIIVNGAASPVSASDPPIPLTITTASCEMVTGSGSGVGNVVAMGEWVAVREGSLTGDPAEFRQLLDELTVRLATIEDDLLAGRSVDRWDLFLATFAAQELSQLLSRSPACGGPGPSHSTVVVGLIADLLAKAIEDGSEVDTEWFIDLVRTAVEVGALGAGSGPAGDALEFDVIAEIQFRIDEAIAAGDADTLRHLSVLALQMGYESLEDAAVAGLEEVGA